MKIFQRTYEGDRCESSLITFRRISDEGFAVIVQMFGRSFYFRRRGPKNKIKPRHIFDVSKIPIRL